MKEKDKILILKLLLKATFVLLFVSLFLKILGLNIFGVDTSNAILVNISNFLDNSLLKFILDFILLIVQNFLFFKLCTKSNGIKKQLFFSIILSILIILLQRFLYYLNNMTIYSIVYYCITFVLLILTAIIIDFKILCYNKNTINKMIKKCVFYIFLCSLYQVIILYLRNITYSQILDSMYDLILNFDYTILLMATYYLKMKKEFNIEKIKTDDYSLTKILNERLSFDEIKIMVIKFNDFKKHFKESNKTDKIVIILYLFFSILSEIINVSLVIFVAYLNNVIIECLFIITSFLISRKVFGAFHLNSAIKCWLLSNISFYLLSKLSFNVSISFVIPVFCGILLAYITSKFIKKNNKDLYKGMLEKDLKEIVKDKKLTKLEYEILKNYYCDDVNMNKLTFVFHYSRAQLYRYKTNAEKKIVNN